MATNARYRRVLRDNIQGLTKPVIHRMAVEAGNPRVSGLVYEEIRQTGLNWLNEFLKAAITFVENRRARTVEIKDVDKLKTPIYVYEDLYIPKLPFQRIVREVGNNYKTDLRYSTEAVDYIQRAFESYILSVFEKATKYRKVADRETLYPVDVQQAVRDLKICLI
jgi:histone H4